MKVYVVVAGVYEDGWPVGVYSSPEAAMTAHPVGTYTEVPTRRPDYDGWQNDKDFEDYRRILVFDLDLEPVR